MVDNKARLLSLMLVNQKVEGRSTARKTNDFRRDNAIFIKKIISV
jgi:hypothetical protein